MVRKHAQKLNEKTSCSMTVWIGVLKLILGCVSLILRISNSTDLVEYHRICSSNCHVAYELHLYV